MILKKIISSLLLICFLSGCAQNTALLGPIYTFGSTGNIYQAGLTYGSNEALTKVTGKSAGDNLKEILQPDTNDSELRKLLKKRIIEVRKKLNTNPSNLNKAQ